MQLLVVGPQIKNILDITEIHIIFAAIMINLCKPLDWATAKVAAAMFMPSSLESHATHCAGTGGKT
jgi:hypothetical protein